MLTARKSLRKLDLRQNQRSWCRGHARCDPEDVEYEMDVKRTPPPPSPPKPEPPSLADFPADVRWQVGKYET